MGENTKYIYRALIRIDCSTLKPSWQGHEKNLVFFSSIFWHGNCEFLSEFSTKTV